MPRSSSEQVTDRILRLAAYIAQRRDFTLEQATTDVEGYDTDKGHEAVRTLFRRDLEVLRAEFGIEAPYDSDAAQYELRPAFFTPSERRALIAAAGAVVITLEGEGDTDPEALGSAVDDDRAEVFLTVTPDALHAAQGTAGPDAGALHVQGQAAERGSLGGRHLAPALVPRGQ